MAAAAAQLQIHEALSLTDYILNTTSVKTRTIKPRLEPPTFISNNYIAVGLIWSVCSYVYFSIVMYSTAGSLLSVEIFLNVICLNANGVGLFFSENPQRKTHSAVIVCRKFLPGLGKKIKDSASQS